LRKARVIFIGLVLWDVVEVVGVGIALVVSKPMRAVLIRLAGVIVTEKRDVDGDDSVRELDLTARERTVDEMDGGHASVLSCFTTSSNVFE
jgi:hypothetical protein